MDSLQQSWLCRSSSDAFFVVDSSAQFVGVSTSGCCGCKLGATLAGMVALSTTWLPVSSVLVSLSSGTVTVDDELEVAGRLLITTVTDVLIDKQPPSSSAAVVVPGTCADEVSTRLSMDGSIVLLTDFSDRSGNVSSLTKLSATSSLIVVQSVGSTSGNDERPQ